MADELLQIRVTADFKEAEGAFLRLGKVATSFESNIRSISANLNREFNKIVGSAELFGDASNVVEDKMSALKTAMVSLMTIGFQPMNKEVQQLMQQYNALGATLTPIAPKIKQVGQGVATAGDSVKKSTQQWTNWALVLQDLPYGFRGIQNNLPALIGGIAGAAGAIYFIASALIAFTTAYEKEITAFIYGISGVDSAQQKLNTTVADGIGQAKAETATNASLLIIINDVTKSTNERKDALTLLKEKYKGNIELQKTDITDGEKLIEITNKISDALLRKARAETLSKLIAEEEANVFKLQNAKGEQVVKNLGFLGTAFGIIKSAGNGVTTSMNIVNDAFDYQSDAVKASKDNISIYTNKLNENTLAQIKNNDAGSIGGKPPKAAKKTKEDPNYYTKIIEEQQKIFTDGLDNELKYADDNNDKKLAILQNYTNSLNHWYELGFIQESFYLNKSADLHKQIYDTKKSIEEQASKDQKVINERNLQNSLDTLKIQSDVETKLLLKGGKSTAADRIKILEDYKNKLYDLASVGGYTAAEFDKIDDALVRVDAAIAGSKDQVKSFSVSWTDTINGINQVIMSFVNDSMFALGDSIGKALAGENVDVINTFGTLLADALKGVGTQLIAFATASLAAWALLKTNNPVTALAALGAGIAAVAAGAYMKSNLEKDRTQGTKKFANGGIISGPTMGLMGEYPGAKSNPEVVAPLDKLKSMIGGGGGQFLLRGQDLLLAVNRAQKASNLKGQTISLA